MPISDLTIRENLLAEVRRFIEHARDCPGVRRIALIGSLTTDKDNPKDADVLVTVDDDADLTAIGNGRPKTEGARAEQK